MVNELLVPTDDPVLHRVSEPVAQFDFGTAEFVASLERLNRTFDHFFNDRLGVGTGAPQISWASRVFVAQDFEPGPSSPRLGFRSWEECFRAIGSL